MKKVYLPVDAELLKSMETCTTRKKAIQLAARFVAQFCGEPLSIWKLEGQFGDALLDVYDSTPKESENSLVEEK